MSTSLEELLRQAAAKGLTHLSLWPVPTVGGGDTYWKCRASPSTQHHYVDGESVNDPVPAVRDALERLPGARKRQPKVTATVTEPIDMDESAERLTRLADLWEKK